MKGVVRLILTEAMLQNFITKRIISFNDVVESDSKEKLLMDILHKVHKYKITPPGKDGRWSTYIPDKFAKHKRKRVCKKSWEDLITYLLEFYENGGDNARSFESLYFEWADYKSLFVKVENKRHALSQSTVTRYYKDYEKYIRGSELSCLSTGKMNAITIEKLFLKVVKDNDMPERAAKNLFSYVNQTLEYSYRNDYITENYFHKVDKKRILSQAKPKAVYQDSDRVLTRTEMNSLDMAINSHLLSHKGYAPDYAVKLAMATGMRVGEIAAVKWSDIDGKFLRVDRSEHRIDYGDHYDIVIDEPKCLKHRKIPLHQKLIAVLEEIKEECPKNDEGYIFAYDNGERVQAHAISNTVIRRSKEAGMKQTSIHTIRRTFSSELRKVMDVNAVASIMGHLPSTNDMCYNYDTLEIELKSYALDTVFSNVVNSDNTQFLANPVKSRVYEIQS